MKKTTLKDIADQLGLSQNSISVALRGNPGLNSETRELILRTAQEMGYNAKKKKDVRAKNILLISKTSTAGDSYFFNHLFVMMQREITTLGYTLQSINTEHMENAFAEQGLLEQYLAQNSIAGILMLGDIDEATCKTLSQIAIPIVGTSFYLPGFATSSVVEDNISGAYLLVQHLAQRGYRSMGFIGNLQNVSFWERYSSFKGALARLHLPQEEGLDLLDMDAGDYDCLQRLEQALAQTARIPQVFICCNDQMAATAIKALHNCGLRCPEDVAVVGFDNNEIARLSTPTITSIDTSRNLQGTLSVRLLDSLISGQTENNLRLVLPVRLQEGDSVGKLV